MGKPDESTNRFATVMWASFGCALLLGGGLLVAVVLGIAVIWKVMLGGGL